MKILDFPTLRQTYEYDCGATAVQAVLVYYGLDIQKEIIMKLAGTDKSGTKVNGILKVLKHYGLQYAAEEMNIEKIKECLKRKIPVIVLLQAWSKKKNVNWENNWSDGHYSVAIGYTKDKIIFADPASIVRTYLTFSELKKRWHDKSSDGKKYVNFGIAVYGKKPEYSSKKNNPHGLNSNFLF